jgi:hypothetical protein
VTPTTLSSDPNKIARIPPAMCDRFVSPSRCVWPNLMGRSNFNQSESYNIQRRRLQAEKYILLQLLEQVLTCYDVKYLRQGYSCHLRQKFSLLSFSVFVSVQYIVEEWSLID